MSLINKKIPDWILIAVSLAIFFILYIWLSNIGPDGEHKEMQARADLKNLELGLNIFYNDQGFYPPSSPRPKLQIAGPPDLSATPDHQFGTDDDITNFK